MKILAFDTSTAQGSVAVIEGEASAGTYKLLAERVWRREKSHSEFLTAEIELALIDACLKISDISQIAVGHGPGSFTGIRVAINAARTLSYALSIPVSEFETSQSLIEPVARIDLPALTIINAQKNSYFVAKFRQDSGRWLQEAPTALLSLQELEAQLMTPHLCLGDGCSEVEKCLSEKAKASFVRDNQINDFPLASSLGRLLLSSGSQARSLVWNAVRPLYLRASGAEEKLREDSKS